MKMTGAQAIIRTLELENVDVIFGYPGAAICPFYDALLHSGIRHILTRNEQGAAHAANGYARITGKNGVCVVTSGPGATNLITGIATAYMDSIPMVAITGQVSTELIGKDVFQEADITGATEPFCKHNFLVKKAEHLPRLVKEAFHIASTGRPGPVLIDIPVDIQTREIEFKYPDNVEIRGYKPKYRGHSVQIKRIADAIKESKAPVICAGGGIISSRASVELQQLVDRCRIPVVNTLMGKGALHSSHKLNLGMLGSQGTYAANKAVHNADLLLIIGARVGDRAMSAAQKIAQRAKIVHIDIDPAEIGKNIEVEIPVVGDAALILKELLGIAEKGEIEAWNEEIESLKKKHSFEISQVSDTEYVNPKYLLNILSDMVEEDTVVTTEVGQNQIWAANYFNVKKAGTFITSGGMGTMGYGLPSAIGAKIASPKSKVIVISGDGSFQMSLNELGTMKQSHLGIKIIVFNNSSLGMVRELQKMKFDGRYSQVHLDNNPDFVKLMGAYGFKGESISSNAQVKEAIERMLEDDESYLLECVVDPEESTL